MKIIRFFASENFHILVVKFSLYLNRRVFVINKKKDANNIAVGLTETAYSCIGYQT